MAEGSTFPHLALVQVSVGKPRRSRGGTTDETTRQNRLVEGRPVHAAALAAQCREAVGERGSVLADRSARGLPDVAGTPLLLEVDPGLDLDELRRTLSFEIVSEQEDGFVIVAAESLDLAALNVRIADFAQKVRGSAIIAQVLHLPTGSGSIEAAGITP